MPLIHQGAQTEAASGKGEGPGADETVYKVKGREVTVGVVVDARSGRTSWLQGALRKRLEGFQGELRALRQKVRRGDAPRRGQPFHKGWRLQSWASPTNCVPRT